MPVLLRNYQHAHSGFSSVRPSRSVARRTRSIQCLTRLAKVEHQIQTNFTGPMRGIKEKIGETKLLEMADQISRKGISRKLKFKIRPMRLSDIDKCLLIWSRVQLSEGKQTVISSLADDPEGFYVAELDETGEVVGMCASPMTRADTAFIGFYGVDPQYQGLGIGRELWARSLGRLSENLNVGLYGVPEMVSKYKSAGFVVEDSISMVVFESERGKGDQLKIDILRDLDTLTSFDCSLQVVDSKTEEKLIKKLIQYDSSIQGYPRDRLLRKYLLNDDAPLTLAIVKDHRLTPSQEGAPSSCTLSEAQRITSDEDDFEILGFGCIRGDNNLGGMIGPIYANSNQICEILLKNLLLRYKLEPEYIYSVMPLTSNSFAVELLKTLGFREIEQCSRLFTKFVPSAPYSKVFYVHSPNFSLF